MVRSWWGFWATTWDAAVDENGGRCKCIRFILVSIQVIVFGTILCALGVLYMLGVYISAGVSLWRLVGRDFGDEGVANMKPALQVLYSLSVAQGVLVCYMTINAFRGRARLAKFVANRAKVDKELVNEYLEVAIAACTKDPSFVKGRNFVTHGMDPMMEAKSTDSFLAGIRAVSLAIKDDSVIGRERKELARHLLSRSDSSTHMINRLLQIVDPRCPYNREVRLHAARKVALVASGIRLKHHQFPEMIECISSVLDTSADNGQWNQQQQPVERIVCERADELLTVSMNIICQLAVDGDNRRIVSNTALRKFAMAPLKFHRHDNNHDPILEKHWVRWLVDAICDTNGSQGQIAEEEQPAAPCGGGGGAKRRRRGEIQEVVEERLLLSSKSMIVSHAARGNAISNLQRTIEIIFDCIHCGATQKMQGIQILLHLSLDMSLIMDSTESRKRRFTWILLLITGFCQDYYCTRSLACEKLLHMLPEKREVPSEQSAREFRQVARLALEDLASAFDDEDVSLRTHAAQIMAGLCVICHPIYNFGNEIKETLDGVMPKVVKEILLTKSTRHPDRRGGEAQAAPDVENGGLSQDHDQQHRQHGCTDNEQRRLQEALVSLLLKYVRCPHCNFGNKFWDVANKICQKQGKSPWWFQSFLYGMPTPPLQYGACVPSPYPDPPYPRS